MTFKNIFSKKTKIIIFYCPALLLAAYNGNKEIVELLLNQKDININLQSILK